MKKFSIILISILISVELINGQNMTVTSVPTPTQLVNNTLLGGGITASNITYTGHGSSRGSFASGSSIGFLLDQGVLLTSGFVTDIPGFNTSGATSSSASSNTDADLNSIISTSSTTTDATVLQFDFVASSDSLAFSYIFASEEYPEFNCSSFNDVFAFFLSGPNPAGGNYVKKNLALVPGTNTYVGINTINSGVVGSLGSAANCTAINPSWVSFNTYYNDNPKNMSIMKIKADGYTDVFVAQAKLIAGQTYHIKLAIADVGSTPFSDNGYDSYVFIKANSFTSPSPLPVQLISFTENCIESKNQIELKWSTASEINNDYFEIQKSKDLNNWESVRLIDGNGNSNIIRNYSFVDQYENEKRYYRLKQVDFDGKINYSQTINVKCAFVANSAITFNYNNLEGNCNFSLNAIEDSKMIINIYDAAGRIVNSSIYDIVKGENSIKNEIPQLSNGIYLISLYSTNIEYQFSKKILVNRY